MAQPVWETPAGSLGTIAENKFYREFVVATDPDGGTISYLLLAGNLPSGIQVKTDGTVEGTPKTTSIVQGVPTEVAENTTSTFAIRATSEDGQINDRTFSLTVTGPDAPQFTTPAGDIGTFYDGEQVSFTFTATDPDPGDTIEFSIQSGELPSGLTLSEAGVLSGYIIPSVPLPPDVTIGYDGSAYDLYNFDFTQRSIDRYYEFTMLARDSYGNQSTRDFSMFVLSVNGLTADNNDDTADSIEITADAIPNLVPFINNYPTNGNIGTFRHDNFFAYQFEGISLTGAALEYQITIDDSADLPPGLTFDRDTGWLTGYLPDLGAVEITYSFSIEVGIKGSTAIGSAPYPYTITIIGDIAATVTWLTGTLVSGSTTEYSLGTIDNGEVSLLKVEAETILNNTLYYRLKPGSYPETPGVYNKLPQGLQLLESGNIAGRASFNGFTLDSGTTTFDEDLRTRLLIDPTTFDSKFTFTVNAYTSDGSISVFRTFSIVVLRPYASPYESLYIEAMPPQSDRDLLNSLLQNQDIFQPSSLFRPDDPYFGVVDDVRYVHAFGMATGSLDEYVIALQENHFKKRLVLGEIKTAQALDEDGDVIYEVIYSDVIDSGVNSKGESPGQTVKVPYPFTDPVDGSTEITEVYPNSLINMRDRVIDSIGQSAPGVLPLWMTSKQADGTVLGFTKSWVLAYVKPGESDKIKYYINSQFGEQLNKVDWQVDRYIIDRLLTKNWVVNEDSTDGGSWLPNYETTFNADQTTNPTVSGEPTTFDGDSLRFNHPVDVYEYTDEYNKYTLFPKTNILQ